MKIGFFDSGLGGLTILKATRELLPQYEYVYFGDTANLPYGDKTEDEIFDFTRDAVIGLFEKGALLVIVACNTASAESVRRLQDTILTGVYADRKVLGVIIPTIEALIESGAQNVLLIGTRRTISSGKYDIELKKISSRINLTSFATPKLVPYIESGNIPGACTTLEINLHDKIGEEIDTIVLGCTHYTLLKDCVRDIYNVRVISQDEIIPEKIKSYLAKHTEIETRLSRKGTVKIILSGEEDTRYEALRKEFEN
ncbi:MAG: glutamate racemase [Minisyncoccia bacterium]